jgi:hypothetical protein
MGGKSKKLIDVRTPQGCFGGDTAGQVGRSKGVKRLSNPPEILAHNDDKRKKYVWFTLALREK